MSAKLQPITLDSEKCLHGIESCQCRAVAQPIEEVHLGITISEDLQSIGIENPLIQSKPGKGHALSESEKIHKIEG